MPMMIMMMMMIIIIIIIIVVVVVVIIIIIIIAIIIITIINSNNTQDKSFIQSTSVTSDGLSESPNIAFNAFFSPLTASNSSGRHSNERPFILKSESRSGSTQGNVRRVQSWSQRPWTTICTRCMHRNAVANQPSADDTSIIA